MFALELSRQTLCLLPSLIDFSHSKELIYMPTHSDWPELLLHHKIIYPTIELGKTPGAQSNINLVVSTARIYS